MRNYEINKHVEDFPRQVDFTIEFNVKNPTIPSTVSHENYNHESETGYLTSLYATELCKKLQKKYKWISNWTMTGRSNGWFVLLCNGKQPRQSVLDSIEKTVNEYFVGYGTYLESVYNTK